MFFRYCIASHGPLAHTAALIDHYAKERSIPCAIETSPKKLCFTMQGDEAHISAFMEHLGAMLPVSLFMGESHSGVCDMLPHAQPVALMERAASILPEALQALFNPASPHHLNPLLHGLERPSHFPSVSLKRPELPPLEAHDAAHITPILEACADILAEGMPLDILYEDAAHTLLPLSLAHAPDLGRESLLVCDGEALSTHFALDPKHRMLLQAYERPILTALAHHSLGALPCKKLPLRLPRTALEYLLSDALMQRGVAMVWWIPDASKTPCTLKLSMLLQGWPNPPRIATLPNTLHLISGALPHCAPHSGTSLFEQAIRATLSEHEATPPAAAAYLSLGSTHSGLYALTPQGIKQALFFGPATSSLEDALTAIATLDEGAARLVANTQSLWDATCVESEIPADGGVLLGLFGLFALAMGVEPHPDLRVLYARLQESAMMFSSSGSVKLDMRLVSEGGVYRFDHLRTLRSILSFRLAGVETHMLAYALFESFADFLNDNLHELTRQLGTKQAVVCGDMLEENTLSLRLGKHSQHLYTLLRPIVCPVAE